MSTDQGLAAERSAAAWTRTGLGWLGAGAAVLKYLATDGLFSRSAIVGHLMLLTAVVIYLGAATRYRQMRHSMRAQAIGRAETPSTIHAAPRILLAVSISTVAATTAALVVEFSRILTW